MRHWRQTAKPRPSANRWGQHCQGAGERGRDLTACASCHGAGHRALLRRSKPALPTMFRVCLVPATSLRSISNKKIGPCPPQRHPRGCQGPAAAGGERTARGSMWGATKGTEALRRECEASEDQAGQGMRLDACRGLLCVRRGHWQFRPRTQCLAENQNSVSTRRDDERRCRALERTTGRHTSSG